MLNYKSQALCHEARSTPKNGTSFNNCKFENTPKRKRLLPDVVNVSTNSNHVFTRSGLTEQSRSRLLSGYGEDSLTEAGIDEDKTSPGLTRLRMTPGRLKEKQQLLILKHDEIRQRNDQLKTGGGVSLWPNMLQMRLTQAEVIKLAVQVAISCLLTFLLLMKLHGETFQELRNHTAIIHSFCKNHHIQEFVHQDFFNRQVVAWHKGFLELMDNIQQNFDMSVMSWSYQAYILSYLTGLLILVFYLLDNMLSKNKLTPSRIKKWAFLLFVIGTWTVVMAYGLFLGHCLEREAIRCVQQYSSSLAFLVTSKMDLNIYQSVLLYWRSRFLDHASHGLLELFGFISVRDFLFYLQYYSVPIITILLSPVIKLCCACLRVYRQGEYLKD